MSDIHLLPSAEKFLHRGRFVASQALIWCLACVITGVVIAQAAVWAEHIRAPLLIFPLVVGCGLGLMLVVVMRVANVGHRPTLLAGTMLAGVIAVAGQHIIHYRDYAAARAAFIEKERTNGLAGMFQELAPTIAPGFADYMSGQARMGRVITESYSLRGAAAWASWAMDGFLLAAATIAVVYGFSRIPYCHFCHTWYRPIRTGRVYGDATARLFEMDFWLLEAIPSKPVQPIVAARYRLSHCASGCGQARLQLTSEDEKGNLVRHEAWLDSFEREEVARSLDASIRATV